MISQSALASLTYNNLLSPTPIRGLFVFLFFFSSLMLPRTSWMRLLANKTGHYNCRANYYIDCGFLNTLTSLCRYSETCNSFWIIKLVEKLNRRSWIFQSRHTLLVSWRFWVQGEQEGLVFQSGTQADLERLFPHGLTKLFIITGVAEMAALRTVSRLSVCVLFITRLLWCCG